MEAAALTISRGLLGVEVKNQKEFYLLIKLHLEKKNKSSSGNKSHQSLSQKHIEMLFLLPPKDKIQVSVSPEKVKKGGW